MAIRLFKRNQPMTRESVQQANIKRLAEERKREAKAFNKRRKEEEKQAKLQARQAKEAKARQAEMQRLQEQSKIVRLRANISEAETRRIAARRQRVGGFFNVARELKTGARAVTGKPMQRKNNYSLYVQTSHGLKKVNPNEYDYNPAVLKKRVKPPKVEYYDEGDSPSAFMID